MKIIEISSLDNGAHRTQECRIFSVPSGWAIIPDHISIPDTFPFVDITVKNGIVTSMTARTVPEPEPTPDPVQELTVWDELDAAYQEGVSRAYDQ